MPVKGARTPIEERIADKFLVGDGCWEWTAATDGDGYGQIRSAGRGRLLKAHRVLYELFVGPIPDGLQLDHLCRNHACVRPDHLEPVTNQENAQRGLVGQNYGGKNGRARSTSRRHCRTRGDR